MVGGVPTSATRGDVVAELVPTSGGVGVFVGSVPTSGGVGVFVGSVPTSGASAGRLVVRDR